jgi:hypothetical protein
VCRLLLVNRTCLSPWSLSPSICLACLCLYKGMYKHLSVRHLSACGASHECIESVPARTHARTHSRAHTHMHTHAHTGIMVHTSRWRVYIGALGCVWLAAGVNSLAQTCRMPAPVALVACQRPLHLPHASMACSYSPPASQAFGV